MVDLGGPTSAADTPAATGQDSPTAASPAVRQWRLGLLGHPVSHSKSPRLHHAALASAGLTGTYRCFDAPDANAFQTIIAELRAGRLHGLNVTVPHKLLAARTVDQLTNAARRVGAVNTLWMHNDTLMGDNTDAAGLAEAARPLMKAPLEIAVIVGAGGAARAAIVAALLLGATDVRLINRTHRRAVAVASDFRASDGDAAVSACEDHDAAFEGASAVFQATTQGMGWDSATDGFKALQATAQRQLARALPTALVVDLVYTPALTPWVAAAQTLGLPCDNGLEMLVCQAAVAFQRWTGKAADTAAMHRALQQPLTPAANG